MLCAFITSSVLCVIYIICLYFCSSDLEKAKKENQELEKNINILKAEVAHYRDLYFKANICNLHNFQTIKNSIDDMSKNLNKLNKEIKK